MENPIVDLKVKEVPYELALWGLTGEDKYRREFQRKQDRKFHCKVGRKEAIEKFNNLKEVSNG